MVSGYLLFITVYNNYTTKKLKNKAILNLKQYCMRCYVALSYVFYLMHVKAYIQYLKGRLLRRLTSYKVC